MGLITRYRKQAAKDGWPSRILLDAVTIIVIAASVWQWFSERLSSGRLALIVAALIVLHIIRILVMKQTDEQRKRAVSSSRFMLDVLTFTWVLLLLWNWFEDGISVNSKLILLLGLLVTHIAKLVWQVWRYPRLTPTEQEFYRNSVSLLDYRPEAGSSPE